MATDVPFLDLAASGVPGPTTAMTYMAALSSTWDPFDSKDWDKEKASPACILRIKRYFFYSEFHTNTRTLQADSVTVNRLTPTRHI